MIPRIAPFALGTLLSLNVGLSVAWADSGSLSQTPLFVSESAPPLNMLVMGRDHKLYYEAYNDASDLDGDGVIDVGYKGYLLKDDWNENTPGSKFKIDYYGYFDSNRCYSYSSNRFKPQGAANNKKCTSAKEWSGDFLNYLTTSRMDAMRKVLYGGYRSTDTAKETVLERAHVPQDAHSWGKEYLSEAHDGYKISDYAALSQPSNGKRHLFANTTLSDGTAPLLRYITSSSHRVWEWVSKERPVAGNKCISGSDGQEVNCGTITDRNVRVAVCVAGKLEDNCKTYPNGNSKPTGILHDFGEADNMYFGLLTGSYAKNTAGGTLRSNMASFSEEINSSNGRFTNNTGYIKNDGIVATINRLKTIDFDGSTYNVNCGWITDGPISDGQCSMWGNPVGEMMYETMRYFSGASSAHSAYDIGSNSKDATQLSLPKPNWVSPYKSKAQGGGGYPACAVPVMTVISDINPSYDFKLPGSKWSNLSASGTPSIDSFNASTEVDAIWSSEGGGSHNIFIGESNGIADSAPTAKTVSNLSTVRGLSPEEPSKQGTYYSAGVARFGANNKIGGDKEMMTYSVALASPLPKIEFPVGSNTVTVVPFAKSVGGSDISATSDFQPTNQIVDYYVAQIANTDPKGSDKDENVNSGRPYAQFRINYEDVEQGADHDMDAIALYTLSVNASGQLDISLKSEYAAGGIQQYMGYAISGTTNDGVYLEICDLKNETSNDGATNDKSLCEAQIRYKLNTPPGKDPGWCATSAGMASNECIGLPYNASGTFTPSNTPGATLLNNPLWYAAKYGMPNVSPTDNSGDPENYFLVTNALTLKEQLTKAFLAISKAGSSVTSPKVSMDGNNTGDSTFAYTTSFDVDPWSGALKKTDKNNPGSGPEGGEWSTDDTLSTTGRTILFADDGSLESFTWEHLNEAQQALLNTAPNGTTDDLGESRVSQIRARKLGDIINSSPLLVNGAQFAIGRANQLESSSNYLDYKNEQDDYSTIYVGANDGMLHAFDATDGSERFAFIPSAVIKNLPILTAPDYGEEGGTPHQYFVDGTPVARDVYFGGKWRKVLLGSLGAGGRAVFALDVSDPDDPELLWEFSNEDDSEMGYSVPTPGIVRLHNGKWAAMVPNGYDSGNGNAILFLLDIEDGSLIKKLTATPELEENESMDSLGNGLSRVMAYDVNNDGIVDYAYAGDLLGNLWRFDLIKTGVENPFTTTATADDFKVAFGGKPLYVARDGDGKRQPITAAPLLTRHQTGLGHIVSFGTGRYLTAADKDNTDQQTVYGIWDRKTAGQTSSSSLSDSKGRGDLVEQELTETTFEGKTVYSLSQKPIEWYDGDGLADSNVDEWGWFIDLPASGERLIYNMQMLGNTQLLTTITPNEDPCEAGMTGTAYGIRPTTGGATNYATFDLNRDGTYDAGISGFTYDGGDFSLFDGKMIVNKGDGIDEHPVNSGLTEGRQTWRQLPTEEVTP